jgi:hypothetical protein
VHAAHSPQQIASKPRGTRTFHVDCTVTQRHACKTRHELQLRLITCLADDRIPMTNRVAAVRERACAHPGVPRTECVESSSAELPPLSTLLCIAALSARRLRSESPPWPVAQSPPVPVPPEHEHSMLSHGSDTDDAPPQRTWLLADMLWHLHHTAYTSCGNFVTIHKSKLPSGGRLSRNSRY